MTNEISADWFTGFLEGEGCFGITFGIKYSSIIPRAVFTISQCDEKVLIDIQSYLASQGIASKIYQTLQTYANLKIMPINRIIRWDLKVISLTDLQKLDALLSTCNWHSNKKEEYEKWQQCLKIILEPHTKANLIEISRIATTLNSHKGKRKWTPDLIELRCYEKNGVARLITHNRKGEKNE